MENIKNKLAAAAAAAATLGGADQVVSIAGHAAEPIIEEAADLGIVNFETAEAALIAANAAQNSGAALARGGGDDDGDCGCNDTTSSAVEGEGQTPTLDSCEATGEILSSGQLRIRADGNGSSVVYQLTHVDPSKAFNLHAGLRLEDLELGQLTWQECIMAAAEVYDDTLERDYGHDVGSGRSQGLFGGRQFPAP